MKTLPTIRLSVFFMVTLFLWLLSHTPVVGGIPPLGVDVSSHQGVVNWSQVHNPGGKSFAIIRATAGKNTKDSRYDQNVLDARKEGLIVGSYHFAYPEYFTAHEEAQKFLAVAGANVGVGFLPPALDIEDSDIISEDSHPYRMGKTALSQWIKNWCFEVEGATGVKPVIYATRWYANNYFDANLNQYRFWVPTYPADPSNSPGNLTPWTTWTFQQYRTDPQTQKTDPSSTTEPYVAGTCPGISGYADLDSFNGDLSALQVIANQIPISLAPPTANPASGMISGGFTANWNRVNGATGYRLDVSASIAFSSFVSGYQGLDVGNVTSRSISGLFPSTPYYYRVRAYSAGGLSGNSATISARTGASSGPVYLLAGTGGSGAHQLTLVQLTTNPASETPVITAGGYFPSLDTADDGTIYGADITSLYRIDPIDGTSTIIGTFHTASENIFVFGGIAFSPKGVLYANDGSSLYTVDLNTALATEVGQFSSGIFVWGIAFAPDGRLFGAEFSLYLLDPNTGQVISTIGDLPGDGVVGIDFARDGYIYGVRYDTRKLYRIDPNTGVSTLLGTYQSDLWGITSVGAVPRPNVQLQNNVALNSLSGTKDSETLYKISLPSGQTGLSATISGGYGDCDIYIKYGAAPTLSTYDYSSNHAGNNESISIANPAAGDWYIMLRGYASYSGLTLVASYISTPPIVVTPTETTYVTGKVLTTTRNDWSGYVGMQVVVGSSPVTVTKLGRLMAGGNIGTHTVKLVKASDGTDVAGGAVSIAMSGGTAGQFKYANLNSPVVLGAGTTYYVVSQETVGGDYWYNWDTTVTTTAVAVENGVVYNSGSGSWLPGGSAGQAFGPVDFMYTLAPTETAYVTGKILTTLRNDWSGYVGMQVVVGSSPVTVTKMGRIMASGNSGTHTVKLVKASDGTDVAGGAVSIAMSGGTVGQFKYASLSNPVILAAGTAYYLVSQEAAGGDYWYNWDTTVTTTGVAVESGVVYNSGSGPWYPGGSAGQAFGPVDFMYAPTQNETAYVTGKVLTTLRNDWSGYVGMQVVVGSSPVTVTKLGRIMASGNIGTHTVKLVKASDGTDVAGGAVSIAMSGGTAGQFKYASLSNPVILAAGTAYYVVSQETAGGDYWYNWDTTVTTTAVAVENGVVYNSGSGSWLPGGSAGQAFGPVDFMYTPTPTETAYVTGKVLTTLRNDWSGYVGMQVVVGPSPVTVTKLGRIMASGNIGTHIVKLVKTSDGTDVAGGAVSIGMSGGTVGQFKYASLSNPVVLAAGTAYYVVSQETASGDSWYNWDTTVTTTAVAVESGVVYNSGSGQWYPGGTAGQTFGPVDFKYY